MSSSQRLERALEVYAQYQRGGGDWQALLVRHPDLTDVLESFREDPAAAAAGAENRLGDFRLDREVGRGGTGRVYEAHQTSLQRRVALKVLHEACTANPRALARFRRESRILASLDHPGIVRVFASGEDQGQHWLAMEFVEGEALATHLDRRRAEGGHRDGSLRRMVELIQGVAEALQHAHAAEVVHRDVKPANILLRPDGTAVLGDFGLARDLEAPSLTQTGAVTGTPHYMAPEQVLGHGASCDARTDVWALGATLYECLTLHRAFEGATTQLVLHAVLTREPVDPRRRQPALPTDLVAITQKALEKDPAARYQTAQALADDLRAFLELRPVAARPTSRSRRLVRFVRRRPMVGMLVLLGLLTVGLGTILVWQLPSILADATAKADAEFAVEFEAGLMARVNDQAEPCLGHFGRALELRPGREQAVIGLGLGLLKFTGREAALQALARHRVSSEGAKEVDHCRALLLRRLQRGDEAALLEPLPRQGATWMECWFEAALIPAATDDFVSRSRAAPAAQTRMAEACAVLARAIRLAPRPCLPLHLDLAQGLTFIRVESRHVETAEALLEIWPDNPLAVAQAGMLYLRIDPRRAVTLLQRALELGSQNPVTLINLGIAYENTGRPEEAIRQLAAALARRDLPDEKLAFVVDAMIRNDDRQLGWPQCEDWLRRSPQSFWARRCTALYCVVNDDHARAIELLQSCVTSKPNDFVIQWELAQAQFLGDEEPAARQTLDRLVAQQPERSGADASVHDLRVQILRFQNDQAAVVAELERWTRVKGDDADAWFALGTALLAAASGSADEQALAAAERADYIADGNNAAYLELRAQCLDRLGRSEEAARLRARALQLGAPR